MFVTHHSSSASLLSEIESLPPKNYQRPLHTWPGWCAYSLHITKNMFSPQNWGWILNSWTAESYMFAHLWFCVVLQHLVHSPCPSCPRPPPHLFWVSLAPHRSDYRDRWVELWKQLSRPTNLCGSTLQRWTLIYSAFTWS